MFGGMRQGSGWWHLPPVLRPLYLPAPRIVSGEGKGSPSSVVPRFATPCLERRLLLLSLAASVASSCGPCPCLSNHARSTTLPFYPSYKFTKEDIQRKLAARREKGEVVGGLVTEKARLRGLLEAAQSAGDAEAAAEWVAGRRARGWLAMNGAGWMHRGRARRLGSAASTNSSSAGAVAAPLLLPVPLL
jgi:hypothetical protein